jgi:hypothetical protein
MSTMTCSFAATCGVFVFIFFFVLAFELRWICCPVFRVEDEINRYGSLTLMIEFLVFSCFIFVLVFWLLMS